MSKLDEWKQKRAIVSKKIENLLKESHRLDKLIREEEKRNDGK